jgi:putative addiction module CopG family antidote
MMVLNPTENPPPEIPMRSTQQFSVTLPNEMAQMVKSKVSSGEYASESEVVREGLRALQARDKALETWLRTEVAAAYDELKADPSRAFSTEQVRQHLTEKRKRSASA